MKIFLRLIVLVVVSALSGQGNAASVSTAAKPSPVAGENVSANLLRVEPTYSYRNITTLASTAVQTVAGTLHAITINQAVAASVITIQDGLLSGTCGGTVIGTITMPATLLHNHVTLLYDVSFSTGLCITTATGASNITVSYR